MVFGGFPSLIHREIERRGRAEVLGLPRNLRGFCWLSKRMC
jgi:hypothetical protein